MGLWSFYWTQSCSWPLSSCFSLYKTQNRVLFCIMWLQWDRFPLRLFFFQSFFLSNGLSSPLFFFFLLFFFRSLSIKPFSQQAYSVQTSGTTTIAGETIIFFLSALSPACFHVSSPQGGFWPRWDTRALQLTQEFKTSESDISLHLGPISFHYFQNYLFS